ncbi:hypothetical protein ABTY98_36150 [Streptomyces sp. NPDC096040]|uniref:MmyB family transcriptional regulator n=1 Tax=Streptomyces sp. NPDC096040 TaxID=3155541 RepID=UPI00331F9608
MLGLDPDATAYLVALTQDRPADVRRARRTRAPLQPEQVPASILQLIDGWTRNPAHVQNRYTDCLAANALCTALSPNYTPGVNLMRAVFLDPAERALRGDWEGSPREVWPPCARTPDRTPMTRGCATWSVTSPCAASGSAP